MKVRVHISDVKQAPSGGVTFTVFLRDGTDTRNIGSPVGALSNGASLAALRLALKAAIGDMVGKLTPDERLRLLASEIEQEGLLLP